jgi:hypothetical protein
LVIDFPQPIGSRDLHLSTSNSEHAQIAIVFYVTIIES